MTLKEQKAKEYGRGIAHGFAGFVAELGYGAGWDAALDWAAVNARANHDDDEEFAVIPESILVGKTVEA